MIKHFIGWDGEGINGEYYLLQNSEGFVIEKDRLNIRDVLPALIRKWCNCDKDHVNVWYGARYDWDMLFRHEPRELLRQLFGPGEHKAVINDYQVNILPKKILRVFDGKTHIHYDTQGFFQTSFIVSLEKWKIPIPDIIKWGKQNRNIFSGKDMETIKIYNSVECKLLVQIMDQLQRALEKVELGDLSGYWGAGAIASRMLDIMNVRKSMAKYPSMKVRKTYYGGRTELLKRGEYGPVYNYDIQSAYPSATRFLPDLKEANWKEVSGEEALNYDFGVVDVNWTYTTDCDTMGPFPHRVEHDEVAFASIPERTTMYPLEGEGRYHLVEVKEAFNRNLWEIKLGEGWVIEDPVLPFKDYIENMMKERLKLKKAGDFGNIPLKLGANSFYGKFAQYNCDTREPGSYNNWLYASYVTAWTRAQLLKYCKPEAMILFATDGMFSTEPLNCPEGEQLGSWEGHKYSIGKFVLPGIYRVDDKIKNRGYQELDFDLMFRDVLKGKKPKSKYFQFITNRQSLRQYKKYPLCGFYEITKVLDWNNQFKRHFYKDGSSTPRSREGKNLEFNRCGEAGLILDDFFEKPGI